MTKPSCSPFLEHRNTSKPPSPASPLCWALVAALLLSTLPTALSPSPAQAESSAKTGQQTGSAEAFVKQRHDAVMRVLKRSAKTASAKAQQQADLTKLLGEFLDYQELSKRALASHWDAQKKDAQDEFVRRLRQLVERSYQGNLERTLDYQIRYGGEKTTSAGTEVATTARSRKNRRSPEISIDYTLHKKDGAWRVVDIRTDGASLVRNYRNQFNRIINRHSWDELMNRMQRRIDEGDATTKK